MITLVTPLLLLAAIGGWYWFSRSVPPPTPAGSTPVPATATVTANGPTSVVDAAVGLVGLATPWGAAGLEPTVPATAGPVAPGAIAVFGPPAGSRFRAADVVAFYWSWPDMLVDEQRFVVYVVDGDERWPLGQLAEANLGRAYQLRAAVGQTGDFRWEVVLEDVATGATIGRSEPRTIAIVGG